jgi:hypothetical protein
VRGRLAEPEKDHVKSILASFCLHEMNFAEAALQCCLQIAKKSSGKWF